MIDKSNRKWKEIVMGRLSLPTANLGLQLFLKSTVTKLAKEASPSDVEKAVAELYNFFVKYERVLQKEIAHMAT